MDPTTTQASYDRLASAYAQQLGDELDHKPLERQLLASFAHENPGQLGDVGCGPGHITAYLHAQGNDVVGVDLSPAMIAQARQIHPTLTFRQADMRHLPFADGTLSGIVAFYSLIHIPPTEIPAVLHELRRTLQVGGQLLVGFHRGSETRHVESMWDIPVSLDFHFFTTAAMQTWLTQANFTILNVTEREPYPEMEVQTPRTYILAQKPAHSSV